MSRPTLQRLSATACLLLALAAPARADPATYALDPVHTRILVSVDHAGFSSALGTLSGATGTLAFDPDDWSSARVEVEIPVARLDFGDAAWNRAALARNLLDADAHPTATFASTRVVPVDARRAIVHGLLTLRGSSREVALEVVLNAAKRHPLPPFRRTVGFSAATTLRRSDFGASAWKSMIGDVVTLRIEAEATHSRGDSDTEAPAASDAIDSESSPPPDQEPLP